jgi:nitrite reductase/ring-hydroxylating ferredoxin subunit
LASTTDHLSKAGDFYEYICGKLSVLIVRTQCGDLRAYQNVCLHRGNELCSGSGTDLQEIRCSYHRWCWDLDGKLKEVPSRRAFGVLDEDEFGLIPVLVDTWGSLVFINLDLHAEPLHVEDVGHPQRQHEGEDGDRLLLLLADHQHPAGEEPELRLGLLEMPLLLQVKLLRFLQDHQVERVGGREVIDLNVRVLAATSRNLEDEVKAGRFREDLYYRLCVVTLKLPSLRERGEDVLFLAQYFLDRYSNEFGKGQATLMPGARLAIQNHNWPGNVREMENKIQRAVLMAPSRHLDARDLGLENAPDSGRPLSLREARDEAERSRIIDVLRQTGGNISKAAQVLRISRPSLHELLTKQGIKAGEYRVRQLHASTVDPVDR